MAAIGETSSASPKPTDAKPVIVRVKRKASQSWLEINERPLKRALLDFENLSLSGSPGKEESKSKKILVQHVETVSSTEATIDVVQTFVEPVSSANASESKTKGEERRRVFKVNLQQIQDQRLSKARQTQEAVAKNARFEQIWRSRKENKEVMHGKLHEMCQFYDVVRIDDEERANEVLQQGETLEDHRVLCSYLPLLREFIPSAAEEIESDLQAYGVGKEDYVYDFYTVNDKVDTTSIEASHPFPLVQVDEDDYCYGPDDSEYESDNSNAENNPLNDYPDEISEEEDEEVDSEVSDNESGEESRSEESTESEQLELHNLSEDEELFYEDDYDYEEGEGDDFIYDDIGVGGYREA
ncbi:Iwr1 transcription factor [Parasponia andersonii]|uniref:Iwr1 transcription factor n=1 Tax=Parasponia andersonii TaxID=3476 RepID=A0A2P5AZ81_PARAD|nr:Iwr1 transcription factor [Parasponia andersonii]